MILSPSFLRRRLTQGMVQQTMEHNLPNFGAALSSLILSMAEAVVVYWVPCFSQTSIPHNLPIVTELQQICKWNSIWPIHDLQGQFRNEHMLLVINLRNEQLTTNLNNRRGDNSRQTTTNSKYLMVLSIFIISPFLCLKRKAWWKVVYSVAAQCVQKLNVGLLLQVRLLYALGDLTLPPTSSNAKHRYEITFTVAQNHLAPNPANYYAKHQSYQHENCHGSLLHSAKDIMINHKESK